MSTSCRSSHSRRKLSTSSVSSEDDDKLKYEIKFSIKHRKYHHSSRHVESSYREIIPEKKRRKHKRLDDDDDDSKNVNEVGSDNEHKEENTKRRRRCKKHKHIIDKMHYLREQHSKIYYEEGKNVSSHENFSKSKRTSVQIKEESLSDEEEIEMPRNKREVESQRNKRKIDAERHSHRPKDHKSAKNLEGPSCSRQSSSPQARVKKEHSDNEQRNISPPRRRRRNGSSPRNGRGDGNLTIKQEPKNGNEHQWGKKNIGADKKNQSNEKEKPNFGVSGKLAEDTNTYNGVVIKYSEPPEARKPKKKWRLYPFKGDSGLPALFIHRQSAYLLGRDRKVADIPIDHPSCSKQHAALQYRLVSFEREDGTSGKRVQPYIIDLESSNGTFVNNVKIESRKYVQLLERDVIKFGFSSREYVILHEQSKDDNDEDV